MPNIRIRRGMPAYLLIALVGTANPAQAEITVAMTYLRQEAKAPPVLSNLDPIPEDLGIAGAKVALTDTETTEIWVTNEKDDNISVIDTTTLEVVRTLPAGERPRGITFNADRSRAYICASDSDAVQVMDAATGEILHELPSGEDPEQFVLSPDDKHLWIANEDDAVTTVVDVETREVVAQIDVGIEPEGMAVSPDGKIVVTTSETTNMAHWIDTATKNLRQYARRQPAPPCEVHGRRAGALGVRRDRRHGDGVRCGDPG